MNKINLYVKETLKYYDEDLFNRSKVKKDHGYESIRDYVLDTEYYLLEYSNLHHYIINKFLNSKYYLNHNDEVILSFLSGLSCDFHIINKPYFNKNCIYYSKYAVEMSQPKSIMFRCDKIRDDIMDNKTVLDNMELLLKEYNHNLYLYLPIIHDLSDEFEPFLLKNKLNEENNE